MKKIATLIAALIRWAKSTSLTCTTGEEKLK
jgi:hypothetical protein